MIMKKLKMLMLASLVFFAVSSCKKDYPRDIPRWLKDKIKELKKDSKGEGCEKDICRYIWEYSDGTNTIFLYEPGVTPITYLVYDYDGKEVCTYQPSDTSVCPSFDMDNFFFIRKIWTED